MGLLLGGVRAGIEAVLTPFDWLGPFWGLTLLCVLLGIGILYIVAWTTPQKRVERARAVMASAIYEIRLFLDSPKRVFLSQGRLLYSSLLYVAYMLPAFVLMSIPLWLFYLHLEPRHGLEPVAVHRPLVVQIDGVDGDDILVPQNQPGLEITAPPLYVAEQQRLFLRVVPHLAETLTLRLEHQGTAVIEKQIVADPDATMVQPERASGLQLFESVGGEPGLDPGLDGMTAISVSHEAREQRWVGLPMPWWIYGLIVITVAALGLKNRLGVVL